MNRHKGTKAHRHKGAKAHRGRDVMAVSVSALMVFAFCGLWMTTNCHAAPVKSTLKLYKVSADKNQKVFTVMFKGSAQTSGKIIFLKDVADVSPLQAGYLSLGASPLPGAKRVVEKEAVVMLMKKNYGASVKVVFKGAVKTVITAEAFPLSKDVVESFLRKSLAESFNKDESDISLEIVSFPLSMLLPSDAYELRLPLKKLKLSSFLSVPVEVLIEDSVYRRMICGVKLKVYGKVYVTKKTVLKGEGIGGDMIVEGTDDIARLPYDIVSDPSSLFEKVAKENIAEGSVLRKSAFDFPKVVRTGDALEIIGKVGNVIVSAKGRALQDGKMGDVIRVENVDSKKFVYAKVVSSTSVEVMWKD